MVKANGDIKRCWLWRLLLLQLTLWFILYQCQTFHYSAGHPENGGTVPLGQCEEHVSKALRHFIPESS